MTSRVYPYRQNPRDQVSNAPYLNDSIESTNDIITRSDINLKSPSSTQQRSVWGTDNTITQSDLDLKASPTKSRSSFWPTMLWIGLGILIFITLVILVVAPIAALANKGNTTTNISAISTICPTTAITTTVTDSSLPAQCSSYTTITDPTRSPDYSGATSCDQSIFTSTPIWVRFTGSGGTLIASCPIEVSLCGADAPGWYSGIYPSLAGDVKSGYVCFNYNSDICYYMNWVMVTNCNGFYIYFLTAPSVCDLRYCTI